jgi:hypothetical protein
LVTRFASVALLVLALVCTSASQCTKESEFEPDERSSFWADSEGTWREFYRLSDDRR